MADHTKPGISSEYLDFVDEMHARMDDIARALDPENTSATNLPTGAVRFSSAAKKWQAWTGSAWIDLADEYAISISGAAKKLKTKRKFSITGGATAAEVDFDGEGNVVLEVTDIDVDKISGLGTAGKASVGTGADDVPKTSQADGRYLRKSNLQTSLGDSDEHPISQKAVKTVTDAGLKKENNLDDLDDASDARNNLGLGPFATAGVTVSTSGPTGGNNGDVWLEVD